MSIADIQLPPPPVQHVPPPVTTLEESRGSFGMWLFILTELWLFILLFAAYFYLAEGSWQWLAETPPKLRFAIPMLIVLWASAGILYWGERRLYSGGRRSARSALGATVFLGGAFLVLESFDCLTHLSTLSPQTNAYGSIFYTIEVFDGAHVLLGFLMMIYIMFLRLEPAPDLPHRPYHNVAIYWYFCTVVWSFIFALMYAAPNVR